MKTSDKIILEVAYKIDEARVVNEIFVVVMNQLISTIEYRILD